MYQWMPDAFSYDESTGHKSFVAGKGASREYDTTPLERDGMCIVCWERPADHVLGETSVLNGMILLVLARLFNMHCLSSRSRRPRKKARGYLLSQFYGRIGRP